MIAALAPEQVIVQKILDHIDRKTTDLADSVWREPVANYTSQTRFDAGADPAQLTRAARAHELGHRDRRGADRLSSAAVGASGVRVRLGELEQCSERAEAVGDLRVIHPTSLLAHGAIYGTDRRCRWP